MDKKILQQYSDLKTEEEQVKVKIARLENDLHRLSDEMVKDKVKGGLGGWQSFSIEGFPSKEYEYKKKLLNNRLNVLSKLEIKIAETLLEIETFISTVEDSHIRRIIDLRVIQNFGWKDVARFMGAGYSEDACRKAYDRYLERTEIR